ncbi:MAG: hypothetical protein IKP64_00330 [Selenomonadaceae bacterium]|nr:hypothetical protein [Selenomonadaceae bacterium]MBR4381982.1 hypothetical protein [Selenomonadaceae bacterium]
MNRPIKFRGRDLVGKMRFGHYATTGGYPYIIEDGVWFEVEPDSVAQLVGYDSDGREVYEGDTIEFNGGTYTARLEEYWDGDIPAGELCSAIQDVIHTLRPVRLWQECITHVIRIEGEDSPSLPVHRKKLAEAYPPFKTACERFIAAYQDFTKELDDTK